MTEKERLDHKAAKSIGDSVDGSWRFNYMNDEATEHLMRAGITKSTYEVFIVDVFEDKQTFIEEHLNGDTSIIDRFSGNEEMFKTNYQIGVHWVDRQQNETSHDFKYPFIVFYHQEHRAEKWTSYVSLDD